MNLRHATVNDFEAGLALGRRMHEESEFAFLPFDADKVRRFLHHIAGDPDHYCAYVVEHRGRLAGLLVGEVMEYFFCRERLCDDMLLFVERDQRGSVAALALVRALSRLGAGQGRAGGPGRHIDGNRHRSDRCLPGAAGIPARRWSVQASILSTEEE